MPQDTKNDLSASQLDALRETRFFELKREVTDFISKQYAELEARLMLAGRRIPAAKVPVTPQAKISKGENYLGYPYVNLDFPRQFSRERVFAFRTLLWWGHHFSFTLHLQGTALDGIIEILPKLRQGLSGKDYWWCVHPHPWEYHFGNDNYRPLDRLSGVELQRHVEKRGFVKISRQLELERYRELVAFGTQTFREILGELYG